MPNPPVASENDFTEGHYRQLLGLAKETYRFALYDAIDWETRFILWRHDLDLSLNRAAALARIEADEGIRATYFINPRSEFYNPLEPDQSSMIRRIIDLGHQIGLHFDASAAGTGSAHELDVGVAREARWLAEAFGEAPKAFSFHNPTAAHLVHEEESYGGLVNCYSRRFKSEVPYCSDSNGYWRFRRLYDVLCAGTDPRLQVLTHPGWWQRAPMPPRQRIFRCAYGRAHRTLAGYDRNIKGFGRENLSGAASAIDFLRELAPERFDYFDYLWNTRRFDSLLVELWRYHLVLLHERCRRSGATVLSSVTGAPLAVDDAQSVRPHFWVAALGEPERTRVFGTDVAVYARCAEVSRNLTFAAPCAMPEQDLESGCVYLAGVASRLLAVGDL
jgi:hypothetical protein